MFSSVINSDGLLLTRSGQRLRLNVRGLRKKRSKSSQISDVCVLAVEDLQVLLLEKNLLQTLLEQSPRLSQEIGEIMELRRRAVSSVLNAA